MAACNGHAPVQGTTECTIVLNETLNGLQYVKPTIISLAVFEGVVLNFSRAEGYDWRSAATSFVDFVGRIAIELLPLSLSAPLFVWAWAHRFATFPLDSLAALPVLFLSQEFLYYWYHRAAHRIRWFWLAHSVHHSSTELSLAAAYRLGWFSKTTGRTLFYLPLVLVGFPPKLALLSITLNLLYQFWLHAAWIPRLPWIEGILNTPSAHRVHHARNAIYLDANFGGVLVIFDRLFGTYVEEIPSIPCDYGIAGRDESRNPLVVEFREWLLLCHDVALAASWRDCLAFIVGPPGWRPGTRRIGTAARFPALLTKPPGGSDDLSG
jgi:sterol desaturase/sphingolipid hydroxylase (fatty acid hydroxylase superfamily)